MPSKSVVMLERRDQDVDRRQGNEKKKKRTKNQSVVVIGAKESGSGTVIAAG